MTQQREEPCVLALGFFDGVHRGHAALLNRAIQRARENSAAPAVMTFDTHPDTLVRGEAVPLINSTLDRVRLIREGFGINQVNFFRFTQETMHIPWEEFLNNICAELGCIHFVVGYDFRFGWRGEGTAERLREYCRQKGLGCDVIGQVQIDDITVSSTYIRSLLTQGNMARAEKFMGHPHILSDVARQRCRLGRHPGGTTVNMRFAPGVLVPPHGVYATRLRLPEGELPAVTGIGVRPMVGEESAVMVESHILDYEGNLNNRTLTLEFLDYLRPERHFDTLEELSAQLARDGERTRKMMQDHRL